MVNWLKALWGKIWCDHWWIYIDTVADQDLRSGYKFWSERRRCLKCERVQTLEMRDRPR